MTFYGLSSYDRCRKLVELMKNHNMTEINKDELARAIAKHIGSSKFYKTIPRYIDLMQGLGFISPMGPDKFKIDYTKLEDGTL